MKQPIDYALRRVRGVLVVAAFATIGCGSSRRDAPLSEPLAANSATVERGQLVFMDQCYQCHPGGSAGLGPALNDKPLPKFLIRTQVRKGFGPMPAYSEEEISDDDLEALAEYCVTLRRSGE